MIYKEAQGELRILYKFAPEVAPMHGRALV